MLTTSRKRLAAAAGMTMAAASFALATPAAATTATTAAVQSPAIERPMSCTGSNGDVYITISGGQNGFTVSGRGSGFYGHIQIVGPGGLNANEPNRDNPSLENVHGRGSGWVYAIGWRLNPDGTYTMVGRPGCVVS